MDIDTKTAWDARFRVMIGMMGCLANKPTREYLIMLRLQLLKQIERIEVALSKLC